jgi:hypothetical protein
VVFLNLQHDYLLGAVERITTGNMKEALHMAQMRYRSMQVVCLRHAGSPLAKIPFRVRYHPGEDPNLAYCGWFALRQAIFLVPV